MQSVQPWLPCVIICFTLVGFRLVDLFCSVSEQQIAGFDVYLSLARSTHDSRFSKFII